MSYILARGPCIYYTFIHSRTLYLCSWCVFSPTYQLACDFLFNFILSSLSFGSPFHSSQLYSIWIQSMYKATALKINRFNLKCKRLWMWLPHFLPYRIWSTFSDTESMRIAKVAQTMHSVWTIMFKRWWPLANIKANNFTQIGLSISDMLFWRLFFPRILLSHPISDICKVYLRPLFLEGKSLS